MRAGEGAAGQGGADGDLAGHIVFHSVLATYVLAFDAYHRRLVPATDLMARCA